MDMSLTISGAKIEAKVSSHATDRGKGEGAIIVLFESLHKSKGLVQQAHHTASEKQRGHPGSNHTSTQRNRGVRKCTLLQGRERQ